MESKPLAFVIEDDEDLATIFAEALQAAGYRIEIIQDGDEALRQLRAVVPEIIILDLHLPQVSGAEIVSQIRADTRQADTRIIIASADAQMADSLHDNVDLVLLKPITFSQLRDLAVRLRS